MNPIIAMLLRGLGGGPAQPGMLQDRPQPLMPGGDESTGAEGGDFLSSIIRMFSANPATGEGYTPIPGAPGEELLKGAFTGLSGISFDESLPAQLDRSIEMSQKSPIQQLGDTFGALSHLATDPNTIVQMISKMRDNPAGAAGVGLSMALPGMPAPWARSSVRRLLAETHMPGATPMTLEELQALAPEPGVLGAMDQPVTAMPNTAAPPPIMPEPPTAAVDWQHNPIQGPQTYPSYINEAMGKPEGAFPIPIGGVGPSGFMDEATMLEQTGRGLKQERPGWTWWRNPKTPTDRLPANETLGPVGRPGPLPVLRKGRPSQPLLAETDPATLLGSAQGGPRPTAHGGFVDPDQAKRAIVEANYERAYRRAYAITKSSDLAQEAVQDAMSKVMDRIGEVRNPQNLIMKATSRRAFDLKLSASGTAFGKKLRSLDEMIELKGREPVSPRTPEPATDLMNSRIREAYESNLSALDERSRNIADLLWGEGLEVEQVAERLGMSYNDVKNHIQRKLRPQLQKTMRAYYQIPTQTWTKYRLRGIHGGPKNRTIRPTDVPEITQTGGTVPQGGVSIPREVKKRSPWQRIVWNPTKREPFKRVTPTKPNKPTL